MDAAVGRRDGAPSRPAAEPPMATLLSFFLIYLAIGAVLFAHPRSPVGPPDFHWRNQIAVFRDSLPDVLGWPLALWKRLS
jgi:hypothetical protein